MSSTPTMSLTQLSSLTQLPSSTSKENILCTAIDYILNGKKELPIIIAFADSNYKVIAQNWHAAIHKLNINNYIIISLDQESFDYFNKNNITTMLWPIDSSDKSLVLSHLWYHRMVIMNILLKNGFTFIHSDVDAIWLRDPIPDYFLTNTPDFCFSQGTIHPIDIHNYWNFVMCCGLFYVRANVNTQLIFDKLLSEVEQYKDDQVAINKFFHTILKINWVISANSVYTLQINDYSFMCSDTLIKGKSVTDPSITVNILPHHLFQRITMNIRDDNPFVKHILSDKTSQSKIEMFIATGCYFL